MTLGNKPATVQLAIRIPVQYHTMVKKLAAEKGLTITDVFVQYLGYLYGKHWRDREVLNAKYSRKTAVLKTDFELLDGAARELERKAKYLEECGDPECVHD